MEKKSVRKTIAYLFSWTFSLVALFILGKLFFDNLDALHSIRETINILPLLWAIPIYLAGLFIASFAWSWMMRDFAVNLPFTTHLKIFVTTHAARRLPGVFLYVIGRVAMYDAEGVEKKTSSVVAMLENIVIFLSGVLMTIFLLPFTYIESNQLYLLFGGAIIGLVLTNPKFIRYMLNRLGVRNIDWNLGYKNVFTWLFLYMPTWLVGGSILFIITEAVFPLGIRFFPDILAAWCVVGVISTVMVLAPAGLGIAEASLSLLLAPLMPSAIAVVIALINRLILTAVEVLFAVLVIIIFPRVRVSITPPGTENQQDNPKGLLSILAGWPIIGSILRKYIRRNK